MLKTETMRNTEHALKAGVSITATEDSAKHNRCGTKNKLRNQLKNEKDNPNQLTRVYHNGSTSLTMWP